MWSSRIFSVVGRASSQFTSQHQSQLWHRTFAVPSFATIDRKRDVSTNGNGGSNKNSCARRMEITSSTLLPSNSIMFNCNGNDFSLPFHETRRYMSKFLSKSATKRLPLNTKRAKKGYYKGKGGTKEGRLTSKGKFIADPLKKLNLIVPDLEGFPLKPYIACTVPRIPPEQRSSSTPGP